MPSKGQAFKEYPLGSPECGASGKPERGPSALWQISGFSRHHWPLGLCPAHKIYRFLVPLSIFLLKSSAEKSETHCRNIVATGEMSLETETGTLQKPRAVGHMRCLLYADSMDCPDARQGCEQGFQSVTCRECAAPGQWQPLP